MGVVMEPTVPAESAPSRVNLRSVTGAVFGMGRQVEDGLQLTARILDLGAGN